jgi:AraC family transcriptional regulator
VEIELKDIEEKQVAYIFHVGSIEELSDLMGEVVGWVMSEGLQIIGPPYGIYYSVPSETPPEQMKYEVGIPFIGEVKPEGKVKVKKIPDQTVLSTVHRGPYHEVGPTYAALMDHVMNEGYEVVGAPVEIYLNSPMEFPEIELMTEIQFPVVKKESC